MSSTRRVCCRIFLSWCWSQNIAASSLWLAEERRPWYISSHPSWHDLGVCGQLLRTPCLVQTADLTVVRMNSVSFYLTTAVGISSSLLGLDELSFFSTFTFYLLFFQYVFLCYIHQNARWQYHYQISLMCQFCVEVRHEVFISQCLKCSLTELS